MQDSHTLLTKLPNEKITISTYFYKEHPSTSPEMSSDAKCILDNATGEANPKSPVSIPPAIENPNTEFLLIYKAMQQQHTANVPRIALRSRWFFTNILDNATEELNPKIPRLHTSST